MRRDYYLNKLIKKRENGRVKIITGMKGCGKSFLLFNLFKNYLLEHKVAPDHIITLALDELCNIRYRNPFELNIYLKSLIKDQHMYFILLDEIQFVQEIDNPYLVGLDRLGFVDLLLGLQKHPNVDLYVTGSNSKMLSSDVVTQFRDRADQIQLFPLCYSELLRAYDQEPEIVWQRYLTYGGLPFLLDLEDLEEQRNYLVNLFNNTYVRDIIERHKIKNEKLVLDDLIRILASSVGSLINPKKISDLFNSELKLKVNQTTISNYLDFFIDSFLIKKAYRYDVKGRRYIGTPLKYYFSDLGLRNAILGFLQIEENHLMENIIYNELVIRGYAVDVGVVPKRTQSDGKSVRVQLEVDFIAKRGDNQIYIQSALNVATPDKLNQEIASLKSINDAFSKIVIVKDPIIPRRDDFGIYYIGIKDFLTKNDADFAVV